MVKRRSTRGPRSGESQVCRLINGRRASAIARWPRRKSHQNQKKKKKTFDCKPRRAANWFKVAIKYALVRQPHHFYHKAHDNSEMHFVVELRL